MSKTDNFRRQHQEILQVTKAISALLNDKDIHERAGELRSHLSILTGKINVHLSMEDEVLYPRLLKHENNRISDTAKKFINEMGAIKKSFSQYIQKWSSVALIQENQVRFISETKELFRILNTRIEKENSELYSLIDKN